MRDYSIKVYFPSVRPDESRPVFSTDKGKLSSSIVMGWRIYCAETKKAYMFPSDYVIVVDNVEL